MFEYLLDDSVNDVNPLYVFTDDFINLRYHLSAHGIEYGDLLFDECQHALLRHLFLGKCAASIDEPHSGHTGCYALWHRFNCSTALSQTLIDAAVRHCTTVQLVAVSKSLGLDILEDYDNCKRELKESLLDFKRSLFGTMSGSSGSNATSASRGLDNPFNLIEKMSIPQLRHIASHHGLSDHVKSMRRDNILSTPMNPLYVRVFYVDKLYILWIVWRFSEIFAFCRPSTPFSNKPKRVPGCPTSEESSAMKSSEWGPTISMRLIQ